MKSVNTFFPTIVRTILMIAVLLIGNLSIAQEKTGSIEGYVIASETKDSLNAVNINLISVDGKKIATQTNLFGFYKIENLTPGTYSLVANISGYDPNKIKSISIVANKVTKLNIVLTLPVKIVNNESIVSPTLYDSYEKKGSGSYDLRKMNSVSYDIEHNTESYSPINENGFKSVTVNPLSTFSVDVDAASYSNIRRFIVEGKKPPIDAVRIEEMINYFDYDYPDPADENPFSISTEIGDCPWNEKSKLVHIGLQAQRLDTKNLPANNLVFLLDVSGSMNAANKLPLLKKSFTLLVNELRPQDKVAIVVYAGAAGIVLESTATTAANKTKILEALEELQAGGSTAGGQGIQLAYKVATENFIEGGNNRVILATDGDFNIGMSSDGEMQRLIEKERQSGVYLTCLGFGMSNYKDSKLEILADKGNGNFAYIDNLLEAKKVLVTEIGGTLVTLAKDVKIQVEFNPMIVESYRLVGYENRLLNEEDFNDDKKDAGEIGAGHSVTALYEIVLKGSGTSPLVDDLRYQNTSDKVSALGNEILTVKFRYKKPDGQESILLEKNLENKFLAWNQISDDFKFSAAVSCFGMILRESEFKGTASFDQILSLAKESKGKDKNGYRAEFIRIVELSKAIFGTK